MVVEDGTKNETNKNKHSETDNKIKTHDNAGDISGLESGDGELERLEHAVVDSLADEAVQIDGAPEQLDVALTQERDVTVRRRRVDERPQRLALLPEPERNRRETMQWV